MYKINTLFGGKRIILASVVVATFTSAGMAAAGSAPWSDSVTKEPATAATIAIDDSAQLNAPVGDAHQTEGLPTEVGPTETIVVEPTVAPTTDVSPGLGTTPTADVVTEPSSTQSATTAPATTQPATTQPAPIEPATTQPVIHEQVSTAPVTTQAAAHEPAPTEPAPTEPSPTAAPTTTEFHDTVVALGLSLSCAAEANTVTCHWSGSVVPGFAKFLLLRGDGGAKGRVPFQSTDPGASVAVDADVPTGSYSYLVIAVDANGKALVHSNPVMIQIGAEG